MTATAYQRVLRDIDDGHITIVADVELYDPHTGQPHPEPRVRSVVADRAVSHTLPDADGAWWQPMIDAGHLYLTGIDRYGRAFYRLTDAGWDALAGRDATP